MDGGDKIVKPEADLRRKPDAEVTVAFDGGASMVLHSRWSKIMRRVRSITDYSDIEFIYLVSIAIHELSPRSIIRNPQFTCPLRCNAMIRANSKYDHIGTTLSMVESSYLRGHGL